MFHKCVDKIKIIVTYKINYVMIINDTDNNEILK